MDIEDRPNMRVACTTLLICSMLLAGRSRSADSWGGSLAVTSDYLVRGVSRTDDHGALQLDLHYVDHSGFLAGVFASNTQLVAGAAAEAEVDAFIGFAWSLGGDWKSRLVANEYTYPWAAHGSTYDYFELDWNLDFQDWADLGLVYSPNSPRFVPYRGFFSAPVEAVEVNAQRPIWRHLSGTAGVGYSHAGGDESTDYAYWSAGISYDLAPVALAVSYVDTSNAAKSLYYNEAGGRHWIATVIWRF